MASGSSEKHLTVCFLCNEFDVTIWWCTDCQLFMCANCKNGHTQIPSTKNHQIEKRNVSTDVENKSVAQFHSQCEKHNSQFALWCRRCDEFVCADCMTEGHKGHELMTIKQMYDEKEIYLKAISVSANTKKMRLESELKHINVVRRKSASSLASAVESIEKKQTLLKRKIDDLVEKRLSQLYLNSSSEDYDKKEHIVHSKISEVESALLTLERCNRNPNIKECFMNFHEIQKKLGQPFKLEMTADEHTFVLRKGLNIGVIEYESQRETIFVPGINTCFICNENIINKLSLPCNHDFCKDCLDQHFKPKSKCPVCARNYEFKTDVCFKEKRYWEHADSTYGKKICFEMLVLNRDKPEEKADEQFCTKSSKYTKKTWSIVLPTTKKGLIVRELLISAFNKNLLFIENGSFITPAGRRLEQFIREDRGYYYAKESLSAHILDEMLSELAVLGVTKVDI